MIWDGYDYPKTTNLRPPTNDFSQRLIFRMLMTSWGRNWRIPA